MESSFESPAGRPILSSANSDPAAVVGVRAAEAVRPSPGRFPFWRYLCHTEDTNKRLLQHGPNLKHF